MQPRAGTQRDWAIFTQTYGQPLRIGKWAPGASEDDKETLFRAVANIAGDCAGIIPDTMSIDFVEAKNVGSAHQLYKERSDWLDQQISKAVLGQTATTDAVTGGLGSGREHREVQEDLERADARAVALARQSKQDLRPGHLGRGVFLCASLPRVHQRLPPAEGLRPVGKPIDTPPGQPTPMGTQDAAERIVSWVP